MTPNNQPAGTVSSHNLDTDASAAAPKPLGFSDMPFEIVLHIAEHLPQRNLARFLRTCRSFYHNETLQSILYDRDLKRGVYGCPGRSIRWACIYANEELLKEALHYHGGSIDDYVTNDGQSMIYFGESFKPDFMSPLFVAISFGQFAFAVKLIREYDANLRCPQLAFTQQPMTYADYHTYEPTHIFSSFALDILVDIVAHGKVPAGARLLPAPEMAGADDLFNILIDNHGRLHLNDRPLAAMSTYQESLLTLAAHPAVPSSWFEKLLMLGKNSMLEPGQTTSQLPWECLLSGFEGSNVGLFMHLTQGPAQNQQKSFEDNLCGKFEAIVRHYDLDTHTSRRNNTWIMHFASERLAAHTGTDFVLRAFKILLSSPSLNVNRVGWTVTREIDAGLPLVASPEAQVLLQNLAWTLVRAHKQLQNDRQGLQTFQRNVPAMIMQLLSHGADPLIAADTAISLHDTPPILLLASCGHSCVLEPLGALLQAHKAALAHLRLDAAAFFHGNNLGGYHTYHQSGGSQIPEYLSIDVCTSAGENALHLACESPDVSPDVLMLLAGHGIDATRANNHGHTPLHKLCGNRDVRGAASVRVAAALMSWMSPADKRAVLTTCGDGIFKPRTVAELSGNRSLYHWLQDAERELFAAL
ncbi:hypothetical protein MN608_09921 [Microdochium nivale]|nr:hypothetical protein MN608_09921 [Microdochium nivale]